MATNSSIEPPGNAEIAITLFCWWESVSAAPHVLMTLFRKTVPDGIKAKLLSWVGDPEFWAMAPFAMISMFALLVFLLRNRRDLTSDQTGATSPRERDPFTAAKNETARRAQIVRNIERANRRTKILRAMRSLGISVLKDWILGRMGVSLYGTFRRPFTWEPVEGRSDKVDSISFSGGAGREYQYILGARELVVREHPSDSDEYGKEVVRRPTAEDAKYLVFASSYFPWWLLFRVWR